jgi:hypothetical protein
MAETDETRHEGTEETTEETVVNEEMTEEEVEAEVEAGSSDTVPRSELLKAIRARQAAKKRLREMEAEIRAERAKSETESEKAIREAQEKAIAAATAKYKPALVKAGATAALLAASPKKGREGIPRLLRLMDLDAIDLTEDNDLEGVEEEVVRLQEEYPELFNDGSEVETVKKESGDEEEGKTVRRRTTSRSADGAGKKPAPKKLSTSELIMAKMRGDA